jgi:hypothetical protein
MTDENIKPKESIVLHLTTIEDIVKAGNNYEISIKAPAEMGPEYPNKIRVSPHDALFIMRQYKNLDYKGQEAVAFYDIIDKKLAALVTYPGDEQIKKQKPF